MRALLPQRGADKALLIAAKRVEERTVPVCRLAPRRSHARGPPCLHVRRRTCAPQPPVRPPARPPPPLLHYIS